MRRETKIGLLGIVTIILAIWGYQFLKGINVLSSATILYAEYEQVDALKLSTPVMINGFQVGLVSDIYQKKDALNTIVVEFNIDAETSLPKETTAEIVSAGIMGGQLINMVFSGNCSDSDCAQSGDYIKGVTKGVLSSLANPSELDAYMDVLDEGLKKIFESLSQKMTEGNSDGLTQTLNDVKDMAANLKSVSGRLDNLLASSSGSIKGTLQNLESLTDTLNTSSSEIKSLISNAEAFTADLKKADLSGTINEAKVTFDKLQTTLSNADKAVAELQNLLKSAKTGDGAIAMLLNDKEFANKLNVTLKDIDLLMQDIRLHPERYRRILSKKEMPYEAPEKDPGH